MGCGYACFSHSENTDFFKFCSYLEAKEHSQKPSPRTDLAERLITIKNSHDLDYKKDSKTAIKVLVNVFKLSSRKKDLKNEFELFNKTGKKQKKKLGKKTEEISDPCSDLLTQHPEAGSRGIKETGKNDSGKLLIISESIQNIPPLHKRQKSDQMTLRINTAFSQTLNKSFEIASNSSSASRSLKNPSNRKPVKFYSRDGLEIDIDLLKNGFTGEARCRWPDGSAYEGQWKDSKMHGKGTLAYPDNKIYKGEFSSGSKEGFGVMSWSNGQKYEGFWKANKQHGKGSLTIKGKNSPIVIQGIWKNGLRQEVSK